MAKKIKKSSISYTSPKGKTSTIRVSKKKIAKARAGTKMLSKGTVKRGEKRYTRVSRK